MPQFARQLSIRSLQMLMIMGICAAALVFAGWILLSHTIGNLNSRFELQLSNIGEVISNGSRAAVAAQDSKAANRVLDSLGTQPDIEMAAIYTVEGTLLGSYREDVSMLDIPSRRPLHDYDPGAGRVAIRLPVRIDNRTFGDVLLVARLDVLEADRRSATLRSFGAIVLGLLLAFLLSGRLHKVVTQPIVDLASIAQIIATRRDHSIRAEKRTDNEVGTLVDEFNHMLDQIQETEKELAAESKAKSQFLSAMSHELRTPLTSILGQTGAALGGGCGPLPEDLEERFHEIRNSGERLLGIINDLLDLTAIDAGKNFITPHPAPIRDIGLTALAAVSSRAENQGLRLDFQISCADEWMVADPGRVQQILINLLSNAVKFTSEGGEVLLNIAQPKPGADVTFTVSDTGIGIPAELRDRLFKPFTQGDGGLDRYFGGTGLGLALVSKLAKLHGGTVWFESEEGQGSHFYVRLPHETASRELARPKPVFAVVEPVAEPIETRELSPPHDKRPVVLLVDDMEVTRDIYGEFLERSGYRVLTAGSGQEALDQLQGDAADVVLLDIQMPEWDGFETLRQIDSRRSGAKRPPVIALTAYCEEADRERCASAGFDDFFAKPVDLSRLRSTLRKYTAAAA